MLKEDCLKFDNLYNFLKNKVSVQEQKQFKKHIDRCQECKNELNLLQKIIGSRAIAEDKFTKTPSEPEEPHISEEKQELYFKCALPDSELNLIHHHLVTCPKCFQEFSTIYKSAYAEITPEEKKAIKQIEKVKIKDRLTPYKQSFKIPQVVTTLPYYRRIQNWVNRSFQQLVTTRKLSYLAATALLLFISMYVYQKIQNSILVKNAEQEFLSICQNQFITRSEPRPTGGVQFSLIGKVRGAPETDVIDLNSQTLYLYKAIERNPNSSKLNHYLGTIFFFQGNWQKAETYYLKALASDGENAKIYNDLALVNIKRKEYQKAVERLQQAIKLDSMLLEAYYNLAVVYELSDNKKKAIEAWEKYLNVDHDPHSVWKTLAKQYLGDLRAE
jgi:tetratricopeptide (TPR) repeat protein